MAEERAATGKEFLATAIVAFEVTSRVGVAATPSALIDRGFHNTSIFGVFGAAAAAARLLALTQEQFVSALSIAASHASGLHEYTQTGGEVKRLHAGIGAAGGIRSARLARYGMTGPRTALEGRRGYLQAYSAHPKPDLLVADLGRSWALMGCRIKPFACCGIMFQHIDALQSILKEHRLRADDIRSIHAGVDRLSYKIVNTIGPEPVDMTGAQFSIQFTLAMTAVKGDNDFATYLEAGRGGYRDSAILALAHRVTVGLDEECDRAFPDQWLGRVTVTTNDGRVLETIALGKRAVSDKEIVTKFRGLAGTVLSAQHVDEIMQRVEGLEDLRSIGELTSLLTTRRAP
jgi:2-methylcitrate dehydratase PrpD